MAPASSGKPAIKYTVTQSKGGTTRQAASGSGPGQHPLLPCVQGDAPGLRLSLGQAALSLPTAHREAGSASSSRASSGRSGTHRGGVCGSSGNASGPTPKRPSGTTALRSSSTRMLRRCRGSMRAVPRGIRLLRCSGWMCSMVLEQPCVPRCVPRPTPSACDLGCCSPPMRSCRQPRAPFPTRILSSSTGTSCCAPTWMAA